MPSQIELPLLIYSFFTPPVFTSSLIPGILTPCLEDPEADYPSQAEDGVGDGVAEEDVGDTEEPDGGASVNHSHHITIVHQ